MQLLKWFGKKQHNEKACTGFVQPLVQRNNDKLQTTYRKKSLMAGSKPPCTVQGNPWQALNHMYKKSLKDRL